MAVVLLLCASSAFATKWTLTRKKTEGVMCRTPINQLACRLDPNGKVQSLFYGAWGDNSAFGAAVSGGAHIDYLPGPNGYWYTRNWCSSWGMLQRCANYPATVPTPADIAQVKPVTAGGPAFPDNGYDAATGVQTIEYVTAMRVCYTASKKSSPIARIQWDTQKYAASWVVDPAVPPANPPMSNVVPIDGTTRTVQCGKTDPTCAFEEEWVAPEGEVIGGIYTKCKYSQGWGKWWLTGAYKPRYYLKGVHKACSVVPTPYPSGKFLICDTTLCPTGPNVDTCPDFGRYQCVNPCLKK